MTERIQPQGGSTHRTDTDPAHRRGRRSRPDRDAEILRAIEAGKPLEEIGRDFGHITPQAVRKAAKRAGDRRREAAG